jgi:hypothetical protein
MKDPTQTDLRLWLICSGCLSGGLVAIVLIVSVSSGGLVLHDVPRVLPELLLVVLTCIVVGWFAQLIMTSCGLRLSRRTRADLAADYDDRPPATQAGGSTQ